MRVIVLGSRGFVARALTDSLSATSTAVVAVSSEHVDLLKSDAVEALSAHLRPDDAMVMPAALTPDKGRDVATFMKNLTMANHVCHALAAAPCCHLIYISSDAVYPDSPDLTTEETPCAASHLYALMHIAREQMLGHVARERRIPFCVLRPSAIYGAGDTHRSYGPNRFIRTALSKRTIQLFGQGEEERDHVYIDDVIAVIKRVLELRCTGVFNVVTGRAVSFRVVADCVAKHLGGSVKIETIPGTGQITHRRFNAARLRKAFPELEITSIENGIARTVEALRTSAA